MRIFAGDSIQSPIIYIKTSGPIFLSHKHHWLRPWTTAGLYDILFQHVLDLIVEFFTHSEWNPSRGVFYRVCITSIDSMLCQACSANSTFRIRKYIPQLYKETLCSSSLVYIQNGTIQICWRERSLFTLYRTIFPSHVHLYTISDSVFQKLIESYSCYFHILWRGCIKRSQESICLHGYFRH